MKRFLDYGNEFMKQSDWRDLALIKLCLCAVGVMWGMALPKKTHKPATIIALFVFVATYIPLMLKLFRIMGISKQQDAYYNIYE